MGRKKKKKLAKSKKTDVAPIVHIVREQNTAENKKQALLRNSFIIIAVPRHTACRRVSRVYSPNVHLWPDELLYCVRLRPSRASRSLKNVLSRKSLFEKSRQGLVYPSLTISIKYRKMYRKLFAINNRIYCRSPF